MENNSPMTLPSLVIERMINRSVAMNILLIVTGSFLLAVSAQAAIPIPFSPVPWTLQPLALLLIAASLGSARGTAAVVLYLFEGLAGFPVFAGGAAGPAVLVGFTAGYLYAFPAAAWIAGFVSERGWGRSIVRTGLGMALALAVIHLGGMIWLATFYGLGFRAAFSMGVAPFLLSDLVKLAIAAALLPSVQRAIERSHHAPSVP
ncbi:MAG TPA: biotin transporter BioY [Thermoanaerobaculia bacterium]|nr:biotin transporter BioY [Thermoanaerobaculia bacterium]